ncbi:transposase-like zinc-binding domain-containing protein [Dechloromonas agitata]|uniref:transposase-like zinc-binding domain-containing protein n=1 Tax=Dechloromonas agitata TaxID=73030 RepID=UPI0012F93495|nr:hypothetical protein [Dechloromonas agitata]
MNFCKNPACANFGVPANIVKHTRRKGTELATTPGTAYSLVGVGKNRPALKCLLCEETFSLKSNLAVVEEYRRFARYLLPSEPASCPNAECANHAVPVSTANAYYRFGVTNAGTPRYRCKHCKRTFAVGGRATKKQRITHLNKTILLALTNKMPIRRIAKVTGLNAVTLYGKIDFLHRQCMAFAAARERELPTLARSRLYISVDRQDYMVNWSRDNDRRNIILRAVGSADNTTGYVFGMHLNFDPERDPVTIEQDAADVADQTLPYPHRKYARLWLASDYEEALQDAAKERSRKAAKAAKGPVSNALPDLIGDAYEAAGAREDSEVSELKDEDQKLPEKAGMQVREEYSLYGHFQFLKQQLAGVEKLRFFLDQDSGIRAACFAAFAEDIQQKRVDAFFVRIAKEMTVDKKRALVNRSLSEFKKTKAANDKLSDAAIEVLLMREAIAQAQAIGKWEDRWASHPLPTMLEPAKAMCWLTDLRREKPDYEEEHQARLFLKASLSAIDNFFQRIRRSINPLERPLLTASKGRRTWYGYNPYNPAMVGKLLDIYRVMHNFVEVTGKDKKTPAMRLGLVSKAYEPEDILYFEA